MKYARSVPFAVLLLTSSAAHAEIDDATRERGYRTSEALDSGNAAAADEVLTLAEGQPDMVVYFLDSWTPALMKMKRYDVIYKFADVITLQRPYAWPEAADAQRARTAALLEEGKFDQAVVEGKRTFNLCILSRTDDAVALIALAMRGQDAKSEPVIATLVKDQTPPNPPARSLATDLQPAPPMASTTRPAGGVIGTIAIDPAPLAEALAGDVGKTDFDNWFGHGNLLLLSGKPGEAKTWFRKIAEADGMSTQQLTRAIEGIARCIRAEDGNPARANAFVAELQKKP